VTSHIIRQPHYRETNGRIDSKDRHKASKEPHAGSLGSDKNGEPNNKQDEWSPNPDTPHLGTIGHVSDKEEPDETKHVDWNSHKVCDDGCISKSFDNCR